MPKFGVVVLPENSLGFNGKIYHNKTDFGLKTSLFIRIHDGTIYESEHDDRVLPTTIALSRLHRTTHGCKISEKIDISEYKIGEVGILGELKLNIGLVESNSKIISLHEDEIKDRIREKFNGKLLSFKQIHAIKWENISVEVLSRKTGYIGKDTNLNILSNNVNLNIVSGKLIKRDLFKEDYSFESIGIGGLDRQLLDIVRRALSTRAFNPLTIQKLGVKHVKGMLLFGPPGTGKTLIARKIGGLISNLEPKIINGPELLSKYVGQGQENLRNIFKDAQDDFNKNKDNANLHIIIFDEIDAICTVRGGDGTSAQVNSSMTTQLLTLIDGVRALNNIFVIAMTNRKDLIDPALLRAGRIELHVPIGLPDKRGREQIFRIHTYNMQKNDMMDEKADISKLADMTENYSGAEIEAVVKNASARALYELASSDIKDFSDDDVSVTMDHFIRAITEISPSFGRVNRHMQSLIPESFKFRSEKEENMFKNISKIIHSDNRLNTILLHGSSLSGKTTMAAYIARENRVKYTRFLRAIDMISMGEFQKANYITDNIMDAFLSDHSLVIIDDIEIAINYANIGHSASFSNRLYQTLMTVLKTPPFERNHKLTIVMTCSDSDMQGMLSEYVTNKFEITRCCVQDEVKVNTDNLF